MNVDSSIVESYLQGKDDYAGHWLFSTILENGEYAFDRPDSAQRRKVEESLKKISDALNDFVPYNLVIFSNLFPIWKKLIRDVNIILSVGCPASYDAMIRKHGDDVYMIFDLVRLFDYENKRENSVHIMRGLITHELSHICIHNDYPVSATTYKEKLGYITFDEGFAHVLSFSENINTFNFSSMIQIHYQDSLCKLKAALTEYNSEKQQKYLHMSNCGSYWDKFAAITGKLYLATHLDNIHDIYLNGPFSMLSNILN